MKKLLFATLILLCTKLIFAQIIQDISSIRGNRFIIQSRYFNINPVPEPLVLEESNAGEFLLVNQSDTTRRDLLYTNVLKKFYSTYLDQNFDFIVMCPTRPMIAHYCAVMNRQIEGIGWKSTYPDAPSLNAVIAFDIYPLWNYGFPAVETNLLERVLIHEIAHYWLVFIEWYQHHEIAHWQNNLDLFSGDTSYLDPMAYNHWIIKNGQEKCVSSNPNVISKFSDLSLYLMGLLSPQQVPPIYEHVFEPKPGNTYYNDWGPSCGDEHKFTETRTITIQDIINANGERKPSCEKSRKNFSIKFIIVAEKGEAVPLSFVEYVKKYMGALPEAWNRLTSGKSNIGFLETPKIVLNKPDIDFGKVNAKQVKTDTLTITNNSSTPLLIDSIYTNTKWFKVTSRRDTVTKTEIISFPISFTPDTLKSYSDTLYIVSNSDVPLIKISLIGSVALAVVVQNNSGIPNGFGISQNYPNPFNPTTTINYQLPINCHVTLKVFDALGNEVAVLTNTNQTAGYYSATFNGVNLSSGVYLYRLETESFSSTKKFILLK